jgi:uncharacterized protein (TIRG00374 family)
MTVPAESTTRVSRLFLPVLWAALTIALLVALPSLEWHRAVSDLRSIQLRWVVTAVLLNFVILPCWALEWRLLVPLRRIGFRRMFEIVTVTASILNTVPLLAGETSAVALLISRGGLSRGAALSVLALDQLLVAFVKVATLCLAAWLAPIPEWLRRGLLTLVALLAAMLLGLVPLAHAWRRIREALLRSPNRVRRGLARLAEWGEHLDVLRAPGRISTAMMLSLAKKAAELGAIVAIQAAFGIEASLASTALVLAGLSLSTLVPIAPANLGVYEATVFTIYRYLGVAPETALGVAIVQHLCFLVPSVATGYLTLTATQLRQRSLSA